MNACLLHDAYKKRKDSFHSYINTIKKQVDIDIYTVINSTLIRNPYVSEFPKKYFSKKVNHKNFLLLFIKSIFKYYLRQFYFFITYIIGYILFKIFYKKNQAQEKNTIFIDVFFLVDTIIKDGNFNENYFKDLYTVLENNNKSYTFLPRLYGIQKNPFKLIKLLKIINLDKRNFLFEYELISLRDFIHIFSLISLYPFKTLRLLQKESTEKDRLFNSELINDIVSSDFYTLCRYIYGKNIALLNMSPTKIYSWSEFQVIERSFNYGVRTYSKDIELYGCQFFINYETYFNSYVDDLDYEHKTSFHNVLVNGKYYLQNTEKVKYKIGVSLRYRNVFSFNKSTYLGSNILLLGSYIEKDTKYMLESLSCFNSIIFKSHPAIDINRFGKLDKNIVVSNDSIYELFKHTSIVIGTASGSLVEAVASGVSVIIMASQDYLTANPLVKYGKGEIWDIAFSKDEVKKLYHNLTEYRKNNIANIQKIASWYKDNFFIEPTEENIIKAFELDKG